MNYKLILILLTFLITAVACDPGEQDSLATISSLTIEHAEKEEAVADAMDDLFGEESVEEGFENMAESGAVSAENPGASTATVYTNGAIYTVNPDQPWADAVAIQDGIIVAVGTEAEALAAVDESAKIIDLDGHMMMPGFQDVHLHAIEAGMNNSVCFFEPYLDAEAYVEEIAACAEDEQPNAEWVRGAGVNMANLLEYDGFPIDLLDAAVPDRPALILDDLGHGAWANTRAMEAVGYTNMEGDPWGGILVRDEASGRLTGIVLENAQQPLRGAALAPNPANLDLAYDGLLDAVEELNKHGITSVSDAGGYWDRLHERVWQRAETEDMLTVRASNALYVFPDRPFDLQMNDLRQRLNDDSDGLVRFNQAKIYVDGILSQGTGLMLEPYTNPVGLPGVSDRGIVYFEADLLNRYAQELDAAGFQLHFHVTGDAGARLALDVIENVVSANGANDQRHRLTHIYQIHPDDRDRFAELNVIADLQLSPSAYGQDYRYDMRQLIGDREGELLPVFDLYERGATITISSDWDADELSPFVKIESVLFQDPDYRPEMETVIEWMTINPAYLLHHDDMTGSIEVGKFADLIVLDQNIFDARPANISKTQVLMTLLEGEVVWISAESGWLR